MAALSRAPDWQVLVASLPGGLDKRERTRLESQAAWALLALALEERGEPWDNLKERVRQGPKGKPELPEGPAFNLSHSQGLAVCGMGRFPLGVDVERVRVFRPELAERICTPLERELTGRSTDPHQALTQLWTCKESYMKYTGLGMAQGIGETAFSRLGTRPCLERGAGVWFQSLALLRGEERFWLTLCGEGRPPAAGLAVRPVAWQALRPYLSRKTVEFCSTPRSL